MKLELDENFGKRIKELFTENGYDAATVIDEKLGGADDKTIYEVCCREKRCLVSLDLDFSDVIRFPPDKCGGIVVFRASANLTFEIIYYLASQFLRAAGKENLAGKLWIVEPNRIRIHQTSD